MTRTVPQATSSATVLGIAMTLGLIVSPPAHAGVFDATLIEDTYISSDATESNTNFSGGTTLNFRTTTATWRNPLLQFSLPILNPSEQVVKVELILTSASAAAGVGGTPDIEVLATTTAIDLSTVTYNSANPSLHTGGESGTSALLWSGVWSDFSAESVIDGIDFGVGNTVTYMDDNAGGMLAFIQSAISTSTNETVNFGLGFVIREGNGGTTSTGWSIYSQEGTTPAILRITTEPIPEPATIGLVALGAVMMLGRRRSSRVA